MDVANFAVAVIGTIAGIAGAYFAWRALRNPPGDNADDSAHSGAVGDTKQPGAGTSGGSKPPERPGIPAHHKPPVSNERGGDGAVRGKDAFISYAREDEDWVRRLAVRLEAEGLDVFLDTWDIGPGDIFVHKLDEAVRTSMNAIQILSPVSVTKPWVGQEYAALLSASVERGLRFIPVLYAAPGPDEHIEVPPFAATRKWLDFRGVTGAAYDRKVAELARAIRGHKPERV